MVGIVDELGCIRTKRKTLFVSPNEQNVIELIKKECEAVIHEGFAFDCIGASVPGLVDAEAGMWVHSCFSKISNIPLVQILSKEFGRPMVIENDANTCAYGEKMFGHAKDISDFMWVTVSNGVGSGIFINNHIFYGAAKNAGEIGHINVVEDGLECPCGNKGCLEAYAAGPAISKRYANLVGEGLPRLTAYEIAQKAKQGDKNARKIYSDTGVYLGKAIASAVNILNVPMVIVGGGIAMDFPLFESSLRETVEKHIYNKANKSLEIKTTKLGYEASLVGAAAYALAHIG